MRLQILLLVSLFSGGLIAEVDFDQQDIQKRIEPVGKVRIEESEVTKDSSKQQNTSEEVAKKESPGQAIYEQYCVICHRDGLAGAPKFQNKDDWQARLDAKKLEGLLNSVKNGLNAMPAMGTCVDCSDEDLKQAIQYMLPKS